MAAIHTFLDMSLFWDFLLFYRADLLKLGQVVEGVSVQRLRLQVIPADYKGDSCWGFESAIQGILALKRVQLYHDMKTDNPDDCAECYYCGHHQVDVSPL